MRSKLVLALSIALISLIIVGFAWVYERGLFAAPVHPYVSYDYSVTLRNASDHRERRTAVYLLGDEDVGYRYEELVFGATTATVQAVEFSNIYKVKTTNAERARLVRALTAAHVFDLKSDEFRDRSDFQSWLDVRIGNQDNRFEFSTPPTRGDRAAIHKIMLDFAREMKVDRPDNKTSATTTSEGDLQPVRLVSLQTLMAHPQDYHGKRISISGYFDGQFEGMTFCSNKAEVEKFPITKCIWYGTPSSFAKPSDIESEVSGWQRIDGIFFKGPTGHMGLWPGEIQRITRVKVVDPAQVKSDNASPKSKPD